MSTTQIHPRVRWGSVPLGAASCTAPSPKAAKAEKACSWMAGAAFNSGASDTARSPHAALAGLPKSRRQRGGRFRTASVKTESRRPCRRACPRPPWPASSRASRGRRRQNHPRRSRARRRRDPRPGRVLVLARLILPFARLQLALEIDLRALLQILLGDPAKPLVEDDHAVPFGLLAALAGCLVAPGIRGGHAQIGDRPAVLRAPDLGIFAEIADQDHLVHATGHDALLLVARIVRGSLILSLGPRRRFRPRHHAFPQHAAPRVTPRRRS